MRRLWLIFAQTVTVCLGLLFIVVTLKPEWVRAPWPSGQRLPPAQSTLPPGPSQPLQGLQAQSPVDGARLPGAPVSYANAVARAAPSVVNIFTRKHIDVPLLPIPSDPHLQQFLQQFPGFTQRKESTNLGSGVIVRDDGHILTNHHVIVAADAIEVSLADGRHAQARLVGVDPESDLAVLKIDLPDLRQITFNDNHRVRVGDVVLAIGNPFGVGQTTTMGIVSAMGRSRLGINLYENYIQTDAAINPGNSGGALVDTEGQLVGINTAIYSESGGSQGIGFAIPGPIAQTILEQIVKTGRVIRGWLGVEPQDITPELARAFRLEQIRGVIIAGVIAGGPAARAGLQVGDIVVSLNEAPVRDAIGFLNQIAPLVPGDKARLRILRKGREQTLEVTAGVRPASTR